MYTSLLRVAFSSLILAGVAACSPATLPGPETTDAATLAPAASGPMPATITFDPAMRTYELVDGSLIPASTSMISAWDIPRNPLTDPDLDDSAESALVRRGFNLFMHTPTAAARLTPGRMACGNCHLSGGQRELALPLVGSAGMFPEYNPRAGIDFTLEDRIVGCFMRSQNAPGGSDGAAHPELPEPDDEEVVALSAYIRWLSVDFAPGENPPWRKKGRIAEDKLIPLANLEPAAGETLFIEHCKQCHGEDGQGVLIGDKIAGPLWGPDSWNDGAGAARLYRLAGLIRYMMPYLNPGVLTDEEAQQIAAYITSKPRPAYPTKGQDYLTEPLPIDAVYYERNRKN